MREVYKSVEINPGLSKILIQAPAEFEVSQQRDYRIVNAQKIKRSKQNKARRENDLISIAIRNMPENLQSIYKYSGIPYSKIADELNISVGSVKQRMFNARRFINSYIKSPFKFNLK